MLFNRANRKAIGLVALVFALGIALGAVGHMLVDRDVFAARNGGGRGGGHRLVNRLTNDLSLTAEQEKQLSEMLADAHEQYAAIRQQVNPQYQKVREEMRNRIRELLTPEQRQDFEEFLSRTGNGRRRKGNR